VEQIEEDDMPAKRKLKIVVCDDQKDVERSIKAAIPKKLDSEIATIVPGDITKLVSTLRKRVSSARKKDSSAVWEKTDLDTADIFVVDYDLIDANKAEYFTGETLAYLARCYSQCGVIVALNQFARAPSFDLTLRVELESFADLNISLLDLSNAGLWFASGWKQYRPWSWPVLPDLVLNLRKRAKDVQNAKLSTTVADFFSFPVAVVERISSTSWETIAPNRSKASQATLADVISSPTLGFRGRESTKRKPNAEQDALIIASRLGAWLASILSAQDILIDSTHLAARCPSILGKSPTLSKFNAFAKAGSKSFAKSKVLAEVAFGHAHWLNGPTWYWTEIERLRLLEEVASPWKKRLTDIVFCEDSSKFSQRKSATAFQSDLPSAYRTRFVEQVPGVEYRPLQRLAAG
jgi:hypothetical protein